MTVCRDLRLGSEDWLLACSDQHLQESEPATAAYFFEWLRTEFGAIQPSVSAAHLVLLGDLFEFWVGDDAMAAGEAPMALELANVLSEIRQQHPHLQVHLVPGNRDFLMGANLAARLGAEPIVDAIRVHRANGQRILMLHGDELCTDDAQYQAFRRQVRSPQWQAHFLEMPLDQRLETARQYRAQSMARQAGTQGTEFISDVNPQACDEALNAHGCDLLLHGHTHRPGVYQLPSGRERWVLSDWAGGDAPRGDGAKL